MKNFLAVFLLLVHFSVSAQNVSITGRVTDQTGDPIPGVAVVLESSPNIGASTSLDGNYKLNSVPKDGTLVFSFIGMETKQEAVNGRSVINVAMQSSSVDLEELVVIGYQSVRKADLTGATSVIKPEETTKVMANSITGALQGLTPGVTVRNGGKPGSAGTLEIRGVASFLNSSPLYVIDGMISDVGANVSPDNIESIQILKDASSAAIYGSRAANGVVIITTKQGGEGEPTISISTKFGISTMPSTYEMMDSYQYAETVRTQYANSGLDAPASVMGPDGTAATFDPKYNTNWTDEVTRTGNQSDINMTISGGNKSGKYLLSGSYYNNKGILIGNNFDRFSFRVNSSMKKGIFEFGENLIINSAHRESPAQGNGFYDMLGMLPIIPVQADEYISAENPGGWGIGTDDAMTYQFNIPALNSINPTTTATIKGIGNFYAKANFTDWLSYKFNVGAELNFGNTRTMLKDGTWRYALGRGESSLTETRSQYTSLLMDHTLNFNKTLGKHHINGVVGYSYQETENRFLTGSSTGPQVFDGIYMDELNSATGTSAASGGTTTHYATQGYLGRVNYSYDDRYLLTLTGRHDSDSRFSEKYRSGFFPSAALAWKISNEEFFNSDVISALKVRASYGVLGIVTVGAWEFEPLLNSNQRYPFGPDEELQNGSYSPQLTNKDLRWEKRYMQNYGFDMGLFDNRLSLSAEYYISESEDALLNQTLGGYLGNLGGNPAVNAGGIRNSGFEIEASLRGGNEDFKWNVAANVTTIKNEVISVGNQGLAADGTAIDYISTGTSRSKVGRGIGEWFLIRTDGLFQSEEEILEYVSSDGTQIQPHAKPGDVKFLDINDDGVINDNDRDFVGSPWPTLQTGMQFNASYKNFSLSAQFVGVFGNTIYNDLKRSMSTYHNINFLADLDPWSPENPDGKDSRLGVPLNDVALTENYRNNCDRWLESGSYFRLRNLELGYTVPESACQKLSLNNVRVYLSAQNLFTLTNYTGADPDVTGNGVNLRGMDNGNWPSDKIYSVGLQFEF